uniref:Uncharacterized protein n=1 Tax=Parascaris univalens TaxID=6257 RepID=A0A915B124_PARUN
MQSRSSTLQRIFLLDCALKLIKVFPMFYSVLVIYAHIERNTGAHIVPPSSFLLFS